MAGLTGGSVSTRAASSTVMKFVRRCLKNSNNGSFTPEKVRGTLVVEVASELLFIVTSAICVLFCRREIRFTKILFHVHLDFRLQLRCYQGGFFVLFPVYFLCKQVFCVA